MSRFLLGLAVGALLVLGPLDWLAHGTEDPLARWRQEARSALSDSARVWQDSLSRLHRALEVARKEAQQSARARKSREARVGYLQDSIAALVGALVQNRTVRDSAATWRDLYEARTRQQMETQAALELARTELGARAQELELVRGELTLAEARIRLLETVTSRGVRASRCRLVGVLPCPSRGVAFLVGAGVTLALTRMVH